MVVISEVLVRQSSAHEARPGGPNGGAGRAEGDDREQWYLLYVGLAGTALVCGSLWFLRSWIARASTPELIAGVMLAIGAGIVLTAIAGYAFLATRVDRASEDVSRALDEIAWGVLPSGIRAPRGLGREARLAGAASAALTRLHSWLDRSRSGISTLEEDLTALRATLPKMQEAVAGTTSYVAELTRETRFLAASTDENGALTQRACVLASVIGQSQRDTGAFAQRVTTAVEDAATNLRECATRTNEMSALVSQQLEESNHCLEADRQLAEYLNVVAKLARRFKLLALHGAMEAARAGAQSEVRSKAEGEGETREARGEEFRVVALEVRRLAVELAKATDDIARTVDGSRRSLQTLHAAATDGARAVQSARNAMTLGVGAMEQATAATTARRSDDSALAEAGTELTILTSAIRERAMGSAKGTGDVADRLAMLDRFLADASNATREIELALARVEATATRARDNVTTIVNTTAAPPPHTVPRAPRGRGKRRPRAISHPAPPARVS